jgi:uncharacterized damage-inducible protein DinB
MHTDPQTLLTLWRYMVHADAQVLQAADTVADDGYRRDQHISFGSIHNLLVHCVWAQEAWLARVNGTSFAPPPDPAAVPRHAIAGRWATVHQELLAFANTQTAASLAEVIHSRRVNGDPLVMPRGAAMLHVADHATYHRGQLNSMVKLAGGKPSSVMLMTWAMQHPPT